MGMAYSLRWTWPMPVAFSPSRLELLKGLPEADLSLGLQGLSEVGHMGAWAGVC